MGDYKVENILITVVIITALFTTHLYFFGDLTDKYTVNNYYQENVSEYTAIMDKVQTNTEQVDEAIQGLTSGNLADIFGALVQGLVNIALLFYNSFVGIGVILAQSIGIYDIGPMAAVWISVATIGVILVFAWGIVADMIKR